MAPAGKVMVRRPCRDFGGSSRRPWAFVFSTRALDAQLAGIEIDIAPLQPHELTTTYAGREQNHDVRIDRRRLHSGQCRFHLIGGEDLDLFPLDFGRRDGSSRITGEDFVPNGILERLVQTRKACPTVRALSGPPS